MAANPPLDITAAPATFQATYAQLAEMHFNRDPAHTAADARERVVAEWGDWHDGGLFAFQALLFDYPGSSVIVVGPASAVDENLASFDTTSGKLLQDSGIATSNVREKTGYPVGVVNMSSGAVVDGAAGNYFYEPTSAVTFTRFVNGVDGQRITIKCEIANKTIEHGVGADLLRLWNDQDALMQVGDTLSIVYNGTQWEEYARNIAPKFFTLADTATPSVKGMKYINMSGSTTVTDFTDGYLGQELYIFALASRTMEHLTGKIEMEGSVDFPMGTSDMLHLVFNGTSWHEFGRKND